MAGELEAAEFEVSGGSAGFVWLAWLAWLAALARLGGLGRSRLPSLYSGAWAFRLMPRVSTSGCAGGAGCGGAGGWGIRGVA